MKRLIAIAFLIMILVVGYIAWGSRYKMLTVSSDKLPVGFELNDSEHQLGGPASKFRLKPGVYTYRATYEGGGQPIIIIDKVDLSTKPQKITLNFSKYSKTEIKKVLCQIDSSFCKLADSNIDVAYVQDYRWAVVKINLPSLERSSAVLYMNGGQWDLVAGPGTDLTVEGAYPQAVGEALNQ